MALAETQFVVTEDSVLHSYETKQEQLLKAAEPSKVSLETISILVSPNRIPIMLVPVSGKNEVIKLNSPLVSEVVEKISEEEMGRRLSKALVEIADIQSAIRSRQIDRALQKLNALQAGQPNVKFYDFLRASIVFLQGNRAEAKRLTEEALKIFPDYQEGRKFLSDLEGGNKK